MGTILGDAKIRLSLDLEAVKKQLEEMSQRGVEVRERPDHREESKQRHDKRDKGVQSTTNAPLGQSFKLARAMAYGNPALINAPPLMAGHRPAVVAAQMRAGRVAAANLRAAHGLAPAGQTALQSFMANFSAGKALIFGLKAFLAAKAVQKVVDGIEGSPKLSALAKGIAPGAATGAADAFLSHVSDEVTGLRAKFTSFGRAAADEKALAAASFRLGHTIPLGGAVDLFHWLQNQNEREEKMKLRVEKQLDREIMQKLGESIRLAMNR